MDRILNRLRFRLAGEAPLLALIALAVLSVGAQELLRRPQHARSHQKERRAWTKAPPPVPVPAFFREWRANFIELTRDEDRLGLVRGIFLGEDSSIPGDVRDEFRAAGLSHLLAASGYNCWIVALVFGLAGKLVVFALSRRLPSRAGLRARQWVGPVSRLTGAWLFWLWTDQSPPITRSVVLISALFTLEVLGWAAAFPRLLFLQYLLSLTLVPSLWHSASFQLTFGCLFGLVHFPPLVEHFAPARGRLMRTAWDHFAAGLGACLGTIPTTWLAFGEINFMSLTTNWFAVPPVSAVLMPAALIEMWLAVPHAPWADTGVGAALSSGCLWLATSAAHVLHAALGVWLAVMPALRYVD